MWYRMSMLNISLIPPSARVGSGDKTSSMLSGQGGLILEIKCPCAEKRWHEREVGEVDVFSRDYGILKLVSKSQDQYQQLN